LSFAVRSATPYADTTGSSTTRLRYSGTHQGAIFGAAPSGERIAYAGAAFFSFDADGRILRAWVLGDLLALLRQLGLRELPG
jgi:predicted ester cyclase